MAPRPYSDKSSLPNDSSNDATSGIPIQNLPETPSPPTFSGGTTPSPTPQELVPVEPFTGTAEIQESDGMPNFGAATPCYPTPGDIMPYDHSLPDFIRQITNQPNLANLHSLSLRVISTLISLHRMSAYLPNLRYLDLEGSFLNSLRDIGCSFKNLQILKVGRCQLESLDGTFGLSTLRELHAQKNFINDVSPCSNLPHIRHIDVSGNRIRNISYAGFLSVCSKLRSIVFTGNPATEVSGYRKHVRRILPQVEILDGIPFINEDNKEEVKEIELIESYCEGSDSSSTEVDVPEFSSVSPSDSMNNFLDSEEDMFFSNKKNKQAKNLANQDQSDGGEFDDHEISLEIKTNVAPQDDFHKVKRGHLEQTKITESRDVITKQKCASILKLDKDNENRSKKTNLLASGSVNETHALFSSKISQCLASKENNPISEGVEAPQNAYLKEKESARPLTATGTTENSPESELRERIKFGAIKKTTFLENSKSKISVEEQTMNKNWEPSKLTTGLPVCGNLTAALRSRKKIHHVWDEEKNQNQLTEEVRAEVDPDDIIKLQAHTNGSGDCFEVELGVERADENDLFEEDVLTTSKKWREAFRCFRSNNRARWEEELESDFTNLLKETSDFEPAEK